MSEMCQHPGGCPQPARKKGWCETHYQRIRTKGDPGPAGLLIRRDATCDVDDCEEPHHAHGYCSMHYMRVQATGQPGPAGKLKSSSPLRRISEHEMGVLSDLSIKQAEAAEFTGLSRQTVSRIRKEIRSGLLKRSEWLDYEVDFLVENSSRMPAAKLAAFLGRTEQQVRSELARLQRNGQVKKGRPRNLQPWAVGNRTLLAKTCPACGELLGADWFLQARQRDAYITRMTDCRQCASSKSATRMRQPKNRERNTSLKAAAQSYTLERASNHGKDWTEKDHEVLSDKSKTTLQKALQLGRTYNATATAVTRFGLASKRPDWDQMRNSDHWHLFWDLEAAS